MKNKGFAFFIAVAMLVSVFAYGSARDAEESGDSSYVYADDADTFDAVVNYDDKIQITYNVLNPDGTWASGPGDIQLGVLKDRGGNTVIRQLYCAAATVVFHKSPLDTHPSEYVDQVSGYVIATPDTANLSSRAPNFWNNRNQIMWLLANGYYGDDAGLSVNNASVQSLRSRYPNLSPADTPISAEIALMATKIAIWRYSDPTVSILSTSLSENDQRKMYNLMKALIADANAHASDPPIGMQMNLVIDNVDARFVAGSSLSTDHYYYGPLKAYSTNPAIAAAQTDKIFLSLSGRNHGSIDFVKDVNGSPSAIALDKDVEYGYSVNSYNPKIPYVKSGETFWLKVPEIDSYQDLSGIAVNASARANSVTYTQATPQLVVYGETDGVHDWTIVQAFVGLMDKGAKGDIYGEAQLGLHGGVPLQPGHVSVSKIMLDIDGNIVRPTTGASFTVSLIATPAGLGQNYKFTLDASNHWTSTAAVSDGAYRIKEDEDPKYKIEAYSSDDDITISRSAIDASVAASTAAIWVRNQQKSGKVRITKTVVDAAGNPVTPLDRDLFVIKLKADNSTTPASFGIQGGAFNGAQYVTSDIPLPVGEYEVSEISDKRYSLDPGSDRKITVEPDKTTSVNIKNLQHTGNVKVRKVVEVNGKAVTPSPGAVFTVTLADEHDPGHSIPFALNEANGYGSTITDIPLGNYSVEETGGGEGWQASYSVTTASVIEGAEIEVTVTNSKTVQPEENGKAETKTEEEKKRDGDKDKDSGGDKNGSSPDTGDPMKLERWTLLLLISAAGLCAAAVLRYSSSRKRKARRPSA
jgi:hypothetical protein